MNKRQVLEVFAKHESWLRPDDVWHLFKKRTARVSAYTFLLRISRQKLLIRSVINDRIAYSITPKGTERLAFLKEREGKDESQRHGDSSSQNH